MFKKIYNAPHFITMVCSAGLLALSALIALNFHYGFINMESCTYVANAVLSFSVVSFALFSLHAAYYSTRYLAMNIPKMVLAVMLPTVSIAIATAFFVLFNQYFGEIDSYVLPAEDRFFYSDNDMDFYPMHFISSLSIILTVAVFLFAWCFELEVPWANGYWAYRMFTPSEIKLDKDFCVREDSGKYYTYSLEYGYCIRKLNTIPAAVLRKIKNNIVLDEEEAMTVNAALSIGEKRQEGENERPERFTHVVFQSA